MSFFVDANIIIYSAVDSPLRPVCLRILGGVAAGDVDARTSTACLEEVWHIERSGRAGNLTGLAMNAYRVFTPLLPVTDRAFRSALELEAPKLGPNDRLHVGTCLDHSIATILSADAGFDGVEGILRVDPADQDALASLLR